MSVFPVGGGAYKSTPARNELHVSHLKSGQYQYAVQAMHAIVNIHEQEY